MRYAAGHKLETRRRIVEAAARVFRRNGFGAGSVDLVMKEAGLTPGGFYAHFKSKDELFEAAFLTLLDEARLLRGQAPDDPGRRLSLATIARTYLSASHRRAVDRGCVLPPLLSELPRRSPRLRRKFEAVLADILAALAASLESAAPSELDGNDRATGALATMIGGLLLARAVADDGKAESLLAACRNFIDRAAGTTDDGLDRTADPLPCPESRP